MTYPNGDFAGRLRALAAMVDGGLPLKVVAIESGGYDTHSNQLDSLPGDLLEIGNSLRAFQRDLEARGIQDRVLVHVWSEFGRRPEENGSGTDHGAAGTGFLIGSKAKGEMVGEFPGLAVLDEDDNLRNTSDFRGVYCALLEQWLGVDAAPIIPNASSVRAPGVGGLMRADRPSAAWSRSLAITAWPAMAAPRKHGKRAKVHRQLARASKDRLVDLTQPAAPAPDPARPRSRARPASCPSAAKEFSLTLSRPLVGRGSVRVELRNNGEDPHNLVVSPEGTAHAARLLLHARPGHLRAPERHARPRPLPALVLARGPRGEGHERHAARAVATRL